MDTNNEQSVKNAVKALDIAVEFVNGNWDKVRRGQNSGASDDPMKTQSFVSDDPESGKRLVKKITDKVVKPDASDNTLNYTRVRIGIREDGGCLFEAGVNDNGFYVSIHESMFADKRYGSIVREQWKESIWK